MRASQLVRYLTDCIARFGDPDVTMQVELDGKRTEQAIDDLLASHAMFLLVSSEARALCPLNDLPEYTPEGVRVLKPKAPQPPPVDEL